MSKLPIAPKTVEVTPAQLARVNDVTGAEDFITRFYPELLERINEDEITQILTIAHMLFKTDPQYLEATTQRQRLPKQ